jgi:hypothetical protein
MWQHLSLCKLISLANNIELPFKSQSLMGGGPYSSCIPDCSTIIPGTWNIEDTHVWFHLAFEETSRYVSQCQPAQSKSR